jgi:hypothetical protein
MHRQMQHPDFVIQGEGFRQRKGKHVLANGFVMAVSLQLALNHHE